MGISRKTSSCILHPLLSSARARVVNSESRTSAMLYLSGTVYNPVVSFDLRCQSGVYAYSTVVLYIGIMKALGFLAPYH